MTDRNIGWTYTFFDWAGLLIVQKYPLREMADGKGFLSEKGILLREQV